MLPASRDAVWINWVAGHLERLCWMPDAQRLRHRPQRTPHSPTERKPGAGRRTCAVKWGGQESDYSCPCPQVLWDLGLWLLLCLVLPPEHRGDSNHMARCHNGRVLYLLIKSALTGCLALAVCNSFLFFFPDIGFDFWPLGIACRILVPWLGIKPMPSAAEVWSPNYWTTRETL